MADVEEHVATGSANEIDVGQIENEDLEKAVQSEDAVTVEDASPDSSGVEEEEFQKISDPVEIADGIIATVESSKYTGTRDSSPTTPTSTDEGVEEIQQVELTPDKEDKSLKSPLALWIIKQNFHPSVVPLIYWAELQKSAGVFGGILFLLISTSLYSLIGVLTTFGMSVLVVAFLYRIGMTIVTAVQKTTAEHPFKHLLEDDLEVSEEAAKQCAVKSRVCINALIRYTQGLFLVKDTVASLKALVILWLTSYIAGSINLLTLIIWAVIVVFTVPKLYEDNQATIDKAASLVKSKACALCGLIEQKVPEKIKVYMRKDKKD